MKETRSVSLILVMAEEDGTLSAILRSDKEFPNCLRPTCQGLLSESERFHPAIVRLAKESLGEEFVNVSQLDSELVTRGFCQSIDGDETLVFGALVDAMNHLWRITSGPKLIMVQVCPNTGNLVTRGGAKKVLVNGRATDKPAFFMTADEIKVITNTLLAVKTIVIPTTRLSPTHIKRRLFSWHPG